MGVERLNECSSVIEIYQISSCQSKTSFNVLIVCRKSNGANI